MFKRSGSTVHRHTDDVLVCGGRRPTRVGRRRCWTLIGAKFRRETFVAYLSHDKSLQTLSPKRAKVAEDESFHQKILRDLLLPQKSGV